MKKVKLNKGKFNMKCKVLGHKRELSKEFFRKKTDKGNEIYKCWVCIHCNNMIGDLVKS